MTQPIRVTPSQARRLERNLRGKGKQPKKVVFQFDEKSTITKSELESMGFTFREIPLHDGRIIIIPVEPQLCTYNRCINKAVFNGYCDKHKHRYYVTD